MAITFFGVAAEPADNDAQAGPNVTFTPPASMQNGDLVYVSHRYRDSAATLSISDAGGQTWNSTTQYNTTNVRARVYWCRFNGTWANDPVFTNTTGTNNADCQMLVFRPTSEAYTWTLESGPNSATYTAPTTPFTVNRAGRTTTAASTVTIAAWHSVDDNSWGTLSGTGWSKTSLGAQYRNNSTNDNSSTFAYFISTTASQVLPTVSQNQTALGGDAGSTSLFTFAETLVTASIAGNSSSSAAGSLGIANPWTGIIGASSTTAVGTAIAFGSTIEGSATANPSGVSSTASAGTVSQPLAPVVAPVSVAIAAGIGAVAVSVLFGITGVSSSCSAGTITAVGSAPGTVLIGGNSSQAVAGSLAGAVTVVGIAGVESTGAAGTLTASSGGLVHAAGQPPGRFAVCEVGNVAVLTPTFLSGSSASSATEGFDATLIVAEPDGVSATALAGDAITGALASPTGVQSGGIIGTMAPIAGVVFVPTGASSAGTIGNLTASTVAGGSTNVTTAAVGVQAAGQVGSIFVAWTFDVPVTGVFATGHAGTTTVQGGDSVSEEIFPAGVQSTVELGVLTTGEALVSLTGLSVTARAGTPAAVGLAPVLGYLTATVRIVPALNATIAVSPAVVADQLFVRPIE